jgi:hypothetical protein
VLEEGYKNLAPEEKAEYDAAILRQEQREVAFCYLRGREPATIPPPGPVLLLRRIRPLASSRISATTYRREGFLPSNSTEV